MKRIPWLKIGLVAVALALGGFLVAASGIIPVKASSGHWPITEWFLRFSMKRSTATHSLGVDVPPLDNPALVLKGAGHYEFGCRSCHGAPGEPQPRIAAAMLPPPPELAARVRESNAKKLFHVVKHGLKFTGMPAWPAQQRDDEVWAVVAFLLTYPELDDTRYRELVHGKPTPTATMQTLASTETAPRVLEAVNRTCVRCHGVDGLGRGSTIFPRLAGQRRAYLEHALEAYADGARHSGIMEPLAAGLDADLRRALAEYYSRLEPAPAAKAQPSRADTRLELGRSIAHEGVPARRIPACVECHGPTGRRTKPVYPTLAGQPADYLVSQLQLFRERKRGGSSYAHLMEEIAPRLDEEQMRAVAAYFESLATP